MVFITHQSHLDVLLASKIMQFLQSKLKQNTEETDVPVTICILESDNDPNSPDFQFIGSNGLTSDLYDEHHPSDDFFQNCFDWVHHDFEHQFYIALHLAHGEFGTYLIIPEDCHPDLLLALHSQPLLENLPF